MSDNYIEVKKAQKEVQQAYFYSNGFSDYVKAVGVSIVGVNDDTVQEGRGDYCLKVDLKQPLPENLKIPSEHNGVKIYTYLGATALFK